MKTPTHKNAAAPTAPETPVVTDKKSPTPQLPPPLPAAAYGKPVVPPPDAEEPALPAEPIGAVRFTKAVLVEILGILGPVMRQARKCTLPVMSHVLIVSKDGQVKIEASDLTTRAIHVIPAPTANSELARKVLAARFERENGAFLVPFDELRLIARNASKDDAIILQGFGGKGRQKNVERTPHHVAVSYMLNGSVVSIDLNSRAVAEFPAAAPEKLEDFKDELTIGADTLRGLQHAMMVSSLDDTRYVLNGVALDGSEKGHHTLVGTDGRRMFMQNSQEFPFTEVHILPACAVTRPFLPLLTTPGWKLAFAKVKGEDHGYWRITAGAWQFITRGIEGNYPNWRQVIPDEGKIVVTLPAASRAYILATIPKLPAEENTKLVIEIQDEVMCVKRGTNSVSVPHATATGGNITIGFNMDFFLDAMRQDFSKLVLSNAESAGLFREGSSQHVLMPIRISA